MYWLINLTSILFSYLPKSLIIAYAKLLAFLSFDILRIRRGLVLQNLETAFGTSRPRNELTQIARHSYFHFILTMFECLASRSKPLNANITFIGEQNLLRSLDKNKGAFILCCHLGNWEAMGAGIATHLVPTHVLVKPIKQSGVQKWVSEMRASNGFMAIDRTGKGDGIRAIYKALKENEAIGFVLDQTRPGEPYIDFFGKPAKTNTGLATLIRKNQIPVVPGFITRKSFGRHEIKFLPQLQLQPATTDKSDIVANSKTFNKVLEECVGQHPEQYFWLHNRWK